MTENRLESQPATLTAVVQITRANTGKVEEYTLILTPQDEPPQEEPKEASDVSHP